MKTDGICTPWGQKEFLRRVPCIYNSALVPFVYASAVIHGKN